MAAPDVIPSKYTDSPTAIRNAPSGQSDVPRLIENTVNITDSSSIGRVFGLVPFQKGFTIDMSATLAIDDIDDSTNTTLDWGWTYIDTDTVDSISNPNGFAEVATTGQAGGILRPTATDGATFVAGSPGWITVTIAGGTVTAAGDITFKGMGAYGIPT